MKVEIELTQEEVTVLKLPDHDWHNDPNPSGCCHCELCDECLSVLHKIIEKIREKSNKEGGE